MKRDAARSVLHASRSSSSSSTDQGNVHRGKADPPLSSVVVGLTARSEVTFVQMDV